MLRLSSIALLLLLILTLAALAQDPPVQNPPVQQPPAQNPPAQQQPVDPGQGGVRQEPVTNAPEAEEETEPADTLHNNNDPNLQYQQDVQVRVTQVEIGEHPTVRAFVSVTDSNGALIKTLREGDFAVTENGTLVPEVKFGNRDELDLPLSIMFVIDISGSMEPAMEMEKQAVREFASQLKPEDRVGLVTFSDASIPEVRLTEDKQQLLDRLDDMSSWGQTALWDGIYLGMQELLADTRPARRALVVLSDGIDNKSLETVQTIMQWYDVNAQQQSMGFSVYALGLGVEIDRQGLSAITERTGGMYIDSPTPEDLTRVYDNILNQIQSEYLLEYESPIESAEGQIIDMLVDVTPVQSSTPGDHTYRSPGLSRALARALWPGLIAIIVLTLILIIATIVKLTRRAWLTVMITQLEGRDYKLTSAGVTIGSSEAADIRIGRDPAMLARHAVISETKDGFLLEAVDPDAPIVMAQRMLSRKLLRSGDKFILGTTSITFMEKVERPGEGLLHAAGVETEEAASPVLAPLNAEPALAAPIATQSQAVAQPRRTPGALVAVAGPLSGQRFELKPGETVIGRSEGDVALNGDMEASRRHAVITLRDSGAVLVDPGSTNGTLLNGVRLQPGIEHALGSGDTLQIGQSRFTLE